MKNVLKNLHLLAETILANKPTIKPSLTHYLKKQNKPTPTEFYDKTLAFLFFFGEVLLCFGERQDKVPSFLLII